MKPWRSRVRFGVIVDEVGFKKWSRLGLIIRGIIDTLLIIL